MPEFRYTKITDQKFEWLYSCEYTTEDVYLVMSTYFILQLREPLFERMFKRRGKESRTFGRVYAEFMLPLCENSSISCSLR